MEFSLRITLLLALLMAAALPARAGAEVIDGVAASIDNEAITLSEFLKYHETERHRNPGQSAEQSMQTLLNRRLMLREARQLRLGGKTDDALIAEYLSLKIFSRISVSDTEIADYYKDHGAEFQGVQLDDVSDRIRETLSTKAAASLIELHMKDLRSKSSIRVLVNLAAIP